MGSDCENHMPCPESYLAWHEWAEKKSRTHRQIRCKGCDRFCIWVPIGGEQSDGD